MPARLRNQFLFENNKRTNMDGQTRPRIYCGSRSNASVFVFVRPYSLHRLIDPSQSISLSRATPEFLKNAIWITKSS